MTAADDLSDHQGSIEVRDNRDTHRFEILVDGEVAGFSPYQDLDHSYAITHTEISPRFGGRGLASMLVRTALDQLRKRHMGVLPYCPFVRSYIARHPEYLDLVPDRLRVDLGLSPE